MKKVILNINGQQQPIHELEFFKWNGQFNYYITVDIKGDVGTTSSQIIISCYSKPTRTVPIPTKFHWFRLDHNQQQSKMENKSNFYQSSPKDLGKTLEINLSPGEEGFFGQCRLFYGPLSLNQDTKQQLKQIVN